MKTENSCRVTDALNQKSLDGWREFASELPACDRVIAGSVTTPLTGYEFEGFTFQDVCFQRPIDTVTFKNCQFLNTRFSDSLTRVRIESSHNVKLNCSANGTLWHDVQLLKCRFVGSALHNMELSQIVMTECIFEDCELNCNFDKFPRSFTKDWESDRKMPGATRSRIGADFICTDLRSTRFFCSDFTSTHFWHSLVGPETLFFACRFDENTTCSGTPLRTARISIENLSTISRNNRLKSLNTSLVSANGVEWIWLKFVSLLWSSTNFGTSGKRLLGVLLYAWMIAFVTIACMCYFNDPQFSNIKPPARSFSSWLVFIVSIAYYTTVTMTTVGYGDIAPLTVESRVVATLLIAVGYFVFAALVSRLSAVLSD